MKKVGLQYNFEQAGFDCLIEPSLVQPFVYKIWLHKNGRYCYFLSSINNLEWIENSFDKPELDLICSICKNIKYNWEYEVILEKEG